MFEMTRTCIDRKYSQTSNLDTIVSLPVSTTLAEELNTRGCSVISTNLKRKPLVWIYSTYCPLSFFSLV